MGDRSVVYFVNETFYRAFADRDLAAMSQLWARNAMVCCIHPGWDAIYDREKILESWRLILSNSGASTISCSAVEVMMWGDVMGVVCFEKIDEYFLRATNLYIQEYGQWRMVHHQAGLTNTVPSVEGEYSNVMN